MSARLVGGLGTVKREETTRVSIDMPTSDYILGVEYR